MGMTSYIYNGKYYDYRDCGNDLRKKFDVDNAKKENFTKIMDEQIDWIITNTEEYCEYIMCNTLDVAWAPKLKENRSIRDYYITKIKDILWLQNLKKKSLRTYERVIAKGITLSKIHKRSYKQRLKRT